MNAGATRLQAAPRYLLGAALVLWGWQCQFLPYALLMALLVEAAVLVAWRWLITDREFNTLSDFSGVLFFLSVIYIFSNEGARGIFVILKVLPFILYPLLITQKFSDRGMMKLSALFVSLRQLDPARSPEAAQMIDISLPFFMVCLVSASAGNQRGMFFFGAVALLLVPLLWSLRPRRFRPATWVSCLLLAIGLAYATQAGLRHLQASIEASFLGIFDQFMWRYRDPNRATTAIGALGRLKLSDRIVLRLKTPGRLSAPMLLREATYNTFGHGIWSTQNSEFSVIDQNSDGSWNLDNSHVTDSELSIATYMIKEKGVIPLPHGSKRIKNVTAIEIARNPLGTVLMDIREGWIRYQVEYSGQVLNERPPDEKDLALLEYYKKDFARLAADLRLASMPAEQAVATVRRFFKDNFRYSLGREQRYPKGHYLAEFLFERREGHCEYFATATALLLRSAGIPARYVVGYAVDEYSKLEGQYIARARHAHSWTLVYIDGAWRTLDTTPAVWASFEEEQSSAIEPLMDIWSWISYTWSRWQSAGADEEQDGDYLLWLLLPLATLLVWRVYLRERIQGRVPRAKRSSAALYPGLDSGFYEVLKVLEASKLPRGPGETIRAWFDRIGDPEHRQTLLGALHLHYRYRFDPHGLSPPERGRLDKIVTELLGRQNDWAEVHGKLPEQSSRG